MIGERGEGREGREGLPYNILLSYYQNVPDL